MLLARIAVTIFGLFIISAGFIMLVQPANAQRLLRKFASTNLINYTEISLRLLVGLALVICANTCYSPLAFQVFGWFMVVTAMILYAVPRRKHYTFSQQSADLLKPLYFRIISPFAFLFGGLILYNLSWF